MKKYILYTLVVLFSGITATAQIDRSKIPASGPTPEVNLGQADEFTLKNGLTVLVVNDTKLPAVTWSLNLNNPPAFEGEKAGVQSLTSALMGKETQLTSKDDFSEKVDFLGARINVSPNGGFGFCLSKYKDQVFQLFAEAALQPKFTQKELDFEKEQLIEGIKSGENSAAAIASNVTSALFYGKNHAAGEIVTEETVNNVTLQDVQDFYNNRFKPSQGFMVFTGDISTKEVKKLLKKYFKSWEEGKVATPTYPSFTDVPTTQIDFVDVPNAVQTELAVMSVSTLKMSDPDYYAATVANYILGGAFGSYLNMNLREANGYTYGARSSLGTGKYYNSSFSATTKVRNEVTDSAVVETLKEIKRIRTELVDEEMIENAKAKFLGSFILESEDKAVSARRAISIKTNNLPADYYKNFIANINSVTKEDIKRVANKYFTDEKARIILVGKASDVLENIEKIEWNGKTLPVNFYDKEANPTERPPTIAIPDGVTVQTVFDSYIKAIGGKTAAEGVQTMLMVAGAEMQGMKLNLEAKNTAKGQSAMVVSVMGNPMQQVIFDGSKGYMVAQGQRIDNTSEQNEKAKNDAKPFPELYIKDATLKGIESINGTNAYAVVMGDKTVYYDMETGLKVQEVTKIEQQGQSFETTIKLSDYKEVDGLKFPHTISQSLGPQEISFKVDTIKINDGVSDADFK